jgi:hypothetical protein
MESDRVMRLKGWEKRFIQLVQDELDKPFDWATANCGHLMGAAVTACQGPAHPVLENLLYLTDEESVQQLLAEYGGLSGLLGSHFQRLPVPILGQQADIGVYMGKIFDRHSSDYTIAEAGCVILDGVAVGKAEGSDRPVRIPIRNLKAVFAV